MLYPVNTREAHHQVTICLDPLHTGRALGIDFSTGQPKGRKKKTRYILLKRQFLEKRRLKVSPKETVRLCYLIQMRRV